MLARAARKQFGLKGKARATSLPVPRRTDKGEQRRQAAQSASASPTCQPPLFPSSTSRPSADFPDRLARLAIARQKRVEVRFTTAPGNLPLRYRIVRQQ